MRVQAVDVVAYVQPRFTAGLNDAFGVRQVDVDRVAEAAVTELHAAVRMRRLAVQEVELEAEQTHEPVGRRRHVGHRQHGLHAVQLVMPAQSAHVQAARFNAPACQRCISMSHFGRAAFR